ncbi:MAG: hypothetical protein IKG81_14480, partial [Bacteroidales bacterium]|nr:hypothetical protein [Bacteroidales bacterium]
MKKYYLLAGLLAIMMGNPGALASTNTHGPSIQTLGDEAERITACDSFSWHGTTYTSGGTYYYDHSVDNLGDAQVDTLYLTINHSASGVDSRVVCDAIIWHGRYYDNEESHPTHTLQTQEGCDSVVTLNLTINHSSYTRDTLTACDSLAWGGRTYYAGVRDTTLYLSDQNTCDSVVNL